MATALATRITHLQAVVEKQRKLIHTQATQIDRQQATLDVQFARIADIQAELDLVKATVCRAAPAFAAALIGPHPGSANASLGATRPLLTVQPAGSRFAMALAASSLAHGTWPAERPVTEVAALSAPK